MLTLGNGLSTHLWVSTDPHSWRWGPCHGLMLSLLEQPLCSQGDGCSEEGGEGSGLIFQLLVVGRGEWCHLLGMLIT